MESKNKTYLAIAVVIVIVSAGGYMWYQNTQTAARKEERYQRWIEWSKTLYIGTTQVSKHPEIQVGYGGVDRGVINMQSAHLLWTDIEDMGTVHPYLAESWELKQNAAGEWYIEYKLRPGLKFHDGEEFTSESVKFSYEREVELFYRETAQETRHKWWHETSWKRLETPDKLTFWQFMPDESPTYLPHPLAALNICQHGFIVGPESTEKYCKETDPVEQSVNQAGIGPYILVDWVHDERVVLEAFEDMPSFPNVPGKAAGIDTVIFSIYADPTTLRMALETGEIDVVHRTLNRADAVDMQSNPDIVVQITKGVGYTRSIGLNTRPEFAPLNDTRVRQALAFATFPEEIVEKSLFGIGSIADSMVHPWMVYYVPVFEELYRQYTPDERIAKAKDLLTEAGYPDGFTTAFYWGGGESEREIATILQAQWRVIGVTLELKVLEKGIYSSMRKEGKLSTSFSGWCPDYADPDTDLFYSLHDESSYLPQTTGYRNPRLGELIDLGKELYDPTGDPIERKAVYEEIQRIGAEDVPGIWLYHDDIWDAYRSWVTNFKFYPYTYMVPAWDAIKEIPSDWETTEPPI